VRLQKTGWMVLALAVSVSAQETRHETVHSSPTVAAQANSDRVPDVSVVGADLRRVLILRFKFGTDLLAGLQKIVKQEKIRNALILSGFGSVRNYQVHQVSNRDLPSHDMFVQNPSAPADIVSSRWPMPKRRLEGTWSRVPTSSRLP
jgi:hypothetical protein